MEKFDRFYSWSLVTYSNPVEFSKLFERANHYAYILHDKDNAVPHYHLLITFAREISLKKIREIINSPSNTLGEPMKDRFCMFRYLTHEDLTDTSKEIYSRDDIVYDVERFWVLPDSNKADKNKEFIKDLLTLNDLDMAIRYGKDYIKNRSTYKGFAYYLTDVLPAEILENLLQDM